MRIVYCADFIYPNDIGGSARYAYDLLRGLVLIGVEVFLITRARSNKELAAGTERLGALVGNNRYFEIGGPWQLIRFSRMVSDQDIIVAHHPVLGLALSVLCPYNHVYYFFHGPYHEEFRSATGIGRRSIRYQMKKIAQLLVLLRSKVIFVLSEFMKSQVESLGIKKTTEVIGPVLDRSKFNSRSSWSTSHKSGKK